MVIKKINLLLIFFLVIFFSILFLNFKTCNFNRFISSSINFGFIYSTRHCINTSVSDLKKILKNLIVGSPAEIYARSVIDSGNYEKINYERFNKLRDYKRINYVAKPKKGDFNFLSNRIIKKNNFNLPNKEVKNWIRSHGGNNNLKFSDYSEINENNIDQIKLSWKFKENKGQFSGVQNNPVFFEDSLFFTTGNGKVISLNAITGEKNWSIQSIKNIATRGITLDITENERNFLFVPIGKKVFKISTTDGKMVKEFGEKGSIKVFTKSAPIINKNNLCIAQLVPAKIKCFNKNDGKFEFEVNIHPDKKDFKLGGTIWGGVAFDENNEIVYSVTGNPRPALIGISRPGKNKNSNSIVAVDLKKRKILWSHQDIIHDLWDYDISAPPVLVDIPFEDKIYKAVVVVSKIGNIYIFDRLSGNSYFDINLKKTKSSKIIGENNSIKQFKVSNPKPLQKLNLTINDFRDKTIFENKNKIEIGHFSIGEFEPPKLGGEVIINSLHGGVTWPGISINPYTLDMFVPINNLPYRLKLEMKTYSTLIEKNKDYKFYSENCAACHGKHRNGDFEYKVSFFNEFEKDPLSKYIPSLVGHSLFNPDFNTLFSSTYLNKIHDKEIVDDLKSNKIKNLFKIWDKKILDNNGEFFYKYNWSQFINSDFLPAIEPPWGEVAAINIVSGEEKWRAKVGNLNNELLGTAIYGGLSSNAGNILVVTGTDDNLIYFINQKNGQILKTFQMDAGGSAPPIIYKTTEGEQISIVSGSMGYIGFKKNHPTTIYTFKLN